MTGTTFRTIEQVATELQVHKETVRRAIAAGNLKASRVGKQIRIKQSEVDKWIGA